VTAREEDGSAEVRGVRLAWDARGPVAGSPFVWAHGLMFSRALERRLHLFGWDAVAEQRRVIAYDARGHGQSTATSDPDDYRWEELATDLLALADALELDRIVGAGSSMGAGTMLHAALAAPERFAALVLVIPPTAWDNRPAQAQLYEVGAQLVRDHGVDHFVELISAMPPPPALATEPDLFHFVPSPPPAALPVVLEGAARTDLPPLDQVATLDQPTLVLAWDGDAGHPLATAERLVDTMPNARLEVAGDLVAVRAWGQSVSAFLGSVE
jgi:pimeloyl-ACP methyl ester carboxylesterase